MNIIINVYNAFRYGEWLMGWDDWKGKKMFGFETAYYDGHHVYFHLYKFYIGVSHF